MWVVAHRGASGHAPENTMAAFRRAVELGARFVETDLQLSRDAHFVAIHDETLERTTTGRGPVREHSLAELRDLDAGSWFDSKFASERIPTLEEVLEFGRETDAVLYLELKPGRAWGIEQAVVGALRDARETSHAVVISFDPTTLANVRRLEPTLMTGYLFNRPQAEAMALAVQVGARQIAPRADLVTRDLVEGAHRAGLQVVTWTINQPELMRGLAAVGVDGIITDYPDRLIEVLREPGCT